MLVGMLVLFGAQFAGATALTDGRDTPAIAGGVIELACATNCIFYAGALICVNSSGYLVPAADTAGYAVVGRGEKYVDTRLYNAYDKMLRVRRGIFRWENADSIADSDIGKICYVTDDQTVNKTGGGQNIIAGAVVDVDSSGVWVDTGKIGAIGAATPASLAVSGAATVGTTLTVTGVSTLTAGAIIPEDVAINLDATDEEVSIVSTTGAAKLVRVYCTNANPTTTALMELDYNADGDADGTYFLCKDNASGDTKFAVAAEGNTTVAGTLTVTGASTLTGGMTVETNATFNGPVALGDGGDTVTIKGLPTNAVAAVLASVLNNLPTGCSTNATLIKVYIVGTTNVVLIPGYMMP
jgi:hypothetical protein